MELDSRQTIIAGILVLFIGKYLNRKFEFLRQFNIPEAVTGGIAASLFLGILHFTFNINIQFSKHYREILLVVFFTAIGLQTEFKSIIKGEKLLVYLTILAVAYIFIQNYLGISIARFFGINMNAGILAGSAALQGGHGNIVAWSPIFTEKYGVNNAMEIGMTSSTLGLIFGGILGGPVAKYLIKKYQLTPSSKENITVGTKEGENLTVDYNSILKVLFMLALSIGVGLHLNRLIAHAGYTLPLFVTCMFGGVLLSNLLPLLISKLKCPEHSPTIAIVSELSLGLFLAMAMMALKFWEIGDHALFILVGIALQVIAIILFSVFVVFRILGKNYDAAVISAGYIGSGLGATPTAMANMAAVTQRYGASPVAFMVIPIVAAFIIQISNALVIQIILALIN
jgi:ESS family glutamate:Na+ symporter